MTDLARITGALEQSYAAIEKLCAVMSAAQWQAQSLCPDSTAPRGAPTADGAARAEVARAGVERSLGYIVGKTAGLPGGSSIVLRLAGPLRRDLHVAVDGRAKVVGHIEHPDVELSTDSLTFV